MDGGLAKMVSKRLKAAKKKFQQQTNPNVPWLAALRQDKTAAIGTAIGSRACYSKLASSFVKCGTKKNGNTLNCRSPYCMRCGGKIIQNQQDIIATALAKYPTDKQQRDNLKHLTILFAVFPFDTTRTTYPLFPMNTAIAAKKDADRMLRNFGAIKRFKGRAGVEPATYRAALLYH